MGVNKEFAGFAWCFSPLIQIFLCPYIGYWTDEMVEARAREDVSVRNPRTYFVGVCAVLAALGLSLAALGKSLGPVAIIVGFTIADISNSLSDSLLRAVQTDASKSREDRVLGHSVLSFMLGLGSAGGYLLSAVNWSDTAEAIGLHREGGPIVLTGIALAVFLPGIALLVFVSRLQPKISPASDTIDTPFVGLLEEDEEKETPQNRRVPWGIVWLCLSQILSWMLLWPIWLFVSSFFGVDVYGGTATAVFGSEERTLFQDGVRRGSVAAGVLAVVTALMSTLLPSSVRRFGPSLVWSGTLILGGVCLIVATLIKHRIWSVVLIGFCGPAWAAQNALSFAALRRILAREKMVSQLGLYSVVLFIAQTLPQLLSGLTLGPLAHATSFSVTLYVAAACGLLASLFPILRLIDLRGADIRIE